jgi:hypothetical protein
MGPVSQSDFAAWQGDGPSTLVGQAFLTTVGGDVKTCAGTTVAIVPANSYVLNVLDTLSLNKNPNNVVYDKQIIDENTRSTTCDAQGNYEFDNVPAQAWIVTATVSWDVVVGYFDNHEGGDLTRNIDLKAGLNKVILTQNDLQQTPSLFP